ncbi:hypothetical protein P3X46_028686 [Hevea brasiliensis]|uniref:BURP domain-containing protein n=1 Tax=Hevea brasiliensis TaxID=3981 RepID=A0ABQ9KT77_HEVBR|nr:hypothetical protein P3X46_028686 [Hevea brasiliensis]
MAKRLFPNSSSSVNVHDPVTSQSRPTFQSGTHIVQVPKDQIYWVPPAENTLIVERPKNPEFQVQRLVVRKLPQRWSCFPLLRRTKSSGRKVSNFPQDEKNSKEIGLFLKGSKILLPNDIKKSMKSAKPKVNMPFSLKMKVPARMRSSSFKIEFAKLVITCHFKVDTFAKGTKILSQQCQINH